MTMTGKLRASDASEWNSHGNIGRGKIRKKLTGRTLLKGNALDREEGEDEAVQPQTQAQAQAPRSRPNGQAR